MTNISPTGGIVPLSIAQPAVAPEQTEKPAEANIETFVPPISKADKARSDMPENRMAEAQLRALAESSDARTTIADRVGDALSNAGLNVVNDGVRAPAETDIFGKPTEMRVAVPDSIPDKIPY